MLNGVDIHVEWICIIKVYRPTTFAVWSVTEGNYIVH